ncbi:MAG: acyl carrier protein [Candidatus Eisenbacteria bacterium]|nr:acyl carrier protein [Candidatus Eisenbacteria bacterium]
MTEIHDYVRMEFAPERASVAPDENLLAQGIVDSLGILKLVTFLEQRFGFEAADDDLVPENFSTLEMIRDFVERKRKP